MAEGVVLHADAEYSHPSDKEERCDPAHVPKAKLKSEVRGQIRARVDQIIVDPEDYIGTELSDDEMPETFVDAQAVSGLLEVHDSWQLGGIEG